MLASFIMSLFDETKDVNQTLKNIYFMSPCFCLGYSLFELILFSINKVALTHDLLEMRVASNRIIRTKPREFWVRLESSILLVFPRIWVVGITTITSTWDVLGNHWST